MKLLKPAFIIAIVAVAMIGVIVPNVFADGSGNSTDNIPFTVELNKENYKLGDKIYMKITADKYIPNTPFTLHSSSYGSFQGCTIPENSLECYIKIPISKFTDMIRNQQKSNEKYICDGQITDKVKSQQIVVYYGFPNNNFGNKSVEINFSQSANYYVDYVSKYNALDKFDVGASVQICDPGVSDTSTLLHEDHAALGMKEDPNNTICMDSDFDLCPTEITQRIFFGQVHTTILWQFFDSNESVKLFNSKLDQYHKQGTWPEIDQITYYPEIMSFAEASDLSNSPAIQKILDEGFLTEREGFRCKVVHGYEARTVYTIICLKDNLILSTYGDDLKIIDYIITKINSSTLPKSIASFVDQSKDPQHYIDRYDNEPTYKEWFDENYSQYSSIYQAVGIDQEDYELEVKINEGIQLIKKIYVPTSSDLDFKWNGNNDARQESKLLDACLSTNCDGYSYTDYRPEKYEESARILLTIYFYEDGGNPNQLPSDHGQTVLSLHQNYPNFQCGMKSDTIFNKDRRSIFCNSDFFSIHTFETMKDFNSDNHGATLMKAALTNIIKNSNEEIDVSEKTTNDLGYTPEPTAKVVSSPNCASGTKLVNGICEIIQTTETSEEGGGCLIATATYGSEMSQQVQQLRELRDNQLLQTESGTAFMNTFNDIYYSFSPTIADMERENPYFKEAVKLAITPMISTLSLMENAETESEVLGIGISVIMLNLGMYLGVPAAVIMKIRKLNL
jgi:hypothetical protein